MRRWNRKQSLATRAATMAGALALAGAGVLLMSQFATIRRYLRMRGMSARRHPTPPGTTPEGNEAPPRWGTSHWPVQ